MTTGNENEGMKSVTLKVSGTRGRSRGCEKGWRIRARGRGRNKKKRKKKRSDGGGCSGRTKNDRSLRCPSYKNSWIFHYYSVVVWVKEELNYRNIWTYLQPWDWQFLKLVVNESASWHLHVQSAQVSHWHCYRGSVQSVAVRGLVFSASCPTLCGSLGWVWTLVHLHSACNTILYVFWDSFFTNFILQWTYSVSLIILFFSCPWSE